MELKQRIQELLTYSGKNISEFSRFVGFKTPQAIRELLKGNTKSISDSAQSKIKAAFPELNMNWLLTGEGNMLKLDNIQEESAANLIPLIPATAFAGMVEGFTPDSIINGDYPKTISPVPGALCAIPISGDSMEPEYHDGALAYIRQINDSAFIPWGHTVIIDTENGAFLKKIYPDEEDTEYVWAKSINPAYPPIHIPKSSIYRIFRVLGTARIYTTM